LLASGRFVTFLDSDDMWLPGKVQSDLDLFRHFPEADAVACDWELWMLGKLHTTSGLHKRLGGSGINLDEPAFAPRCVKFWVNGKRFATGTVMLRREALGQLGPQPYDERLRVFEDWDFEVRLLQRCRVLVSPRVFVRIRLFDDGTRTDRSVRWLPPTAAQLLLKLESRIHVFDKVLAGDLSPDEAHVVELKKQEVLRAREELAQGAG